MNRELWHGECVVSTILAAANNRGEELLRAYHMTNKKCKIEELKKENIIYYRRSLLYFLLLLFFSCKSYEYL